SLIQFDYFFCDAQYCWLSGAAFCGIFFISITPLKSNNMEGNNKNLYALVTGATSGIGRELAKVFAENGYNLVIVARTEEDLQETSRELLKLGINVVPI